MGKRNHEIFFFFLHISTFKQQNLQILQIHAKI